MQKDINTINISKRILLTTLFSFVIALFLFTKVIKAEVVCGEWKDVPGEYMAVLREVCEYGFIQGYSAEEYGYGDSLSRGAAGTIASRFAMSQSYDQDEFDSNEVFDELSSVFSDLPENIPANEWLIKAIYHANRLEIMTGDDGSAKTFRAFTGINTPETFKVFYQAARKGNVLTEEAKSQNLSYSGDPWYSPLMKYLESRKAISNLSLNGGSFFLEQPFLFFKGFDKGLKREEAAFFIASMIEGEVIDESKLMLTVNSADDTILGSPNARVAIVIFSDFQCPACGVIGLEIQEFVQSNPDLVRMEYKHFPLSQHSFAMLAAEAVECAGNQQKFWEYASYLLENQNLFSQNFFYEAADELSLNRPIFNSCLDHNKEQANVLAQKEEGILLEVNATPTIFVNDQKVNYPGIDLFEEYVKEEFIRVLSE